MYHYALRSLQHITEEEINRSLTYERMAELEKKCKEAEEEIKEIRQKLHEQTQKLQFLKIDKFIEVERTREYSSKRVNVHVRIYTLRTLEKETRHDSDYKTSKHFTGLEKKEALEYARELQKKTGLRIVKKNWK